MQNTKSKIVELLFAVANIFHSGTIVTPSPAQNNKYLWCWKEWNSGTRLAFVKNMADIEENENLLKAIDRLELILPEIEDGRNHQQLKRLYGCTRKLSQLYSGIGRKMPQPLYEV